MSYAHLSLEERYVIYHLVLYGLSYREIGRRLNRHHTTIIREVNRNRPTHADDAVYSSDAAEFYANQRKYKARHCLRRSNEQLVSYVQNKIIAAEDFVDNVQNDELFDLLSEAVESEFYLQQKVLDLKNTLHKFNERLLNDY